MRGRSILLSLLLGAAAGGAQTPAPLPSDLLQRVREAYLSLGAVRDAGELRVAPAGEPETATLYAFTTDLALDDGFRFELRATAGDGGGPWLWTRSDGRSAAADDGANGLPSELA
ncbi:MAG: hypothetical protein KDB94_01870, partial [Acidobacteria bacterium]|nr:hypothetical protein [Acidobacteriota bacterium]